MARINIIIKLTYLYMYYIRRSQKMFYDFFEFLRKKLKTVKKHILIIQRLKQAAMTGLM